MNQERDQYRDIEELFRVNQSQLRSQAPVEIWSDVEKIIQTMHVRHIGTRSLVAAAAAAILLLGLNLHILTNPDVYGPESNSLTVEQPSELSISNFSLYE